MATRGPCHHCQDHRADRPRRQRVDGRTERPVLIYCLVTLAAITRIVAAFGSTWTMPLLIMSAGLWIAAFAGFVLGYGPMLILPRRPR